VTRYDGKALIPAPFVHYTLEPERTEDGTEIGSRFIVEIKGKLVSWKGAPLSDGSHYTSPTGYPADDLTVEADPDKQLPAIFAKQAAVQAMFATPGKLLEVKPYDGSPPLTAYPAKVRVEFADGEGRGANWTQYCEYTITLECPALYLNGVQIGSDTRHVQRASDEWQIEPADDVARTYRIQRTVSAQGKKYYSDPPSGGGETYRPWQYASGYVLNVLGLGLRNFDRVVCSGVLNQPSGVQAYNYRRSQQLNELAGTFSVTESWLSYIPVSGIHALEDFTVDLRTDGQNGGLTQVSIQGQVQGLEVRDNVVGTRLTTKYQNALSGWAVLKPQLPAIAEASFGAPINPTVQTANVSLNYVNGVIGFNYQYDNRADTPVVGAKQFSLTVTSNRLADVHAEVPVLGRAAGPVLQAVGTSTATKKGVQIEASMGAGTYGGSLPTSPNTDALVATYAPSATQVFLDENNETFNPYSGRYTRTTAWTYQ
jgi:hypothetical protein